MGGGHQELSYLPSQLWSPQKSGNWWCLHTSQLLLGLAAMQDLTPALHGSLPGSCHQHGWRRIDLTSLLPSRPIWASLIGRTKTISTTWLERGSQGPRPLLILEKWREGWEWYQVPEDIHLSLPSVTDHTHPLGHTKIPKCNQNGTNLLLLSLNSG